MSVYVRPAFPSLGAIAPKGAMEQFENRVQIILDCVCVCVCVCVLLHIHH